jgi:ESF2/ABP1 family protein
MNFQDSEHVFLSNEKVITTENHLKFQNSLDKSGVVYMSRIPPFMKPEKVRYLLSKYGEIGRIYLAEENKKVSETRKKLGGNKKKNYTEGWIEFSNKKDAKNVAMMLNAQPMGGKKSNYYHDDIWNLKYLSGFKWIHLTEQLAYEKKERTKREAMEISQAKKEINLYVKNVNQAKMIEAIKSRKQNNEESETNIKRIIRQRKVQESNGDSEKVGKVLKKLFN